MTQIDLTFEWENEDGTVSDLDPNLYGFSTDYITANTVGNYTISSTKLHGGLRIPSIEERLEAIEKRLAILNLHKDPTHQMLDTLYKKYKMVEQLIGRKDTDDE